MNNYPKKIKRLTTKQRIKLYQDIENNPNKSYYSIAKQHGVSAGYVSSIALSKFNRKKRSEIIFTQLPIQIKEKHV